MSLLYECINTVIAVLISISSGMPNHTASIQLCVQKLRILIEDSDQNCKLFEFIIYDNLVHILNYSLCMNYSKIFRIIGNVKNTKNTSEKCSSA